MDQNQNVNTNQDGQNNDVNTGLNNPTQETNKPLITPTPQKKPKSPFRNFWNRCRIITVIVVAVLIVAIVTARITGVMYIGFKSPSQQVSHRTIVCDIYDIRALESVFASDDFMTKSAPLSEDIKSRDNNESDPNCQYIIWHTAIMLNDLIAMESSLSNLKHLNEKGYFVSGNFPFIDTIISMENRLDSMREFPHSNDTYNYVNDSNNLEFPPSELEQNDEWI